MTRYIKKLCCTLLALLSAAALLLPSAPLALADSGTEQEPAGTADQSAEESVQDDEEEETASDAVDKVEIAQDGTVTLISGHVASELVSSLQLTLIAAPAEGASVGFTPDPALADRVAYSQYHGDGTLHIYLVGTAPLMAQGQDRLTLGVITGAALESVKLAEDALQYVYGNKVVAQTAAQQNALADTPAEGPRQSLQEALDAADQTFGQSDDIAGQYTPESWDALQTAIVGARDTLADEAASDEQLLAALTALNNAIAGLKYAGMAELETALAEAKAYDAAGYTQSSFAGLQAAIQNAEAVLNNAAATAEDWADAVAQLKQAESKLVPVASADGSGDVHTDGPDGGGSDNSTSEPAVTSEPTATPQATAAQRTAPDTGDEAMIFPWLTLLCLSGLQLAALLCRRGRSRR